MRVQVKIIVLIAMMIFILLPTYAFAECNFTVNLKSAPIVSLKKGASYTYEYNIKNTNTTGSSISFSFTNKVKINTITPATFTLGKGYTKVIKVVFQMPLTVATNSDVLFSFKVKTNCNDSQTVSFTVKAEESCSFTLTKNSTPSTITTLAKGRSYTYHYTLKNTSNDTATFSGVKVSNIVSFENLPVTLGHAAVKTIKVTFMMPSNATNNTSVTFSFKITTSCNTSQTVSFTLKAVNPCCTYTIVKSSSPGSKTTLKAGTSYTYNYVVKNTCTGSANTVMTFTMVGIHHITSITPSSFTLNPSQTKTVAVKFTMPNTQAGTNVVFSFTIKPDCSNDAKTVTFTIKAT